MPLSRLENKAIRKITPQKAAELLQDLVRLRTEEPPGDTSKAVDFLTERLQARGLICQRWSRDPGKVNLLVTTRDAAPGPTLLYHSHLDTVTAGEPEAWSFPPFGGELVAGNLYGRGSGDDKASVVAQLMALMAMAEMKLEALGNVMVAAVADEEAGGQAGTKWLRAQGLLQPQALVVGEQTGNHVAIAERVACGIDLTIHGKSAHGAIPRQGDSAILKMARVLCYLEQNYFDPLMRRNHPVLPPPSFSVGMISGGSRWNVVADRCQVKMDRRLLPGESREEAIDELCSILDRYGAEEEPCEYSIDSVGEMAANINTEPAAPFVQLAQTVLLDTVSEPRGLTGYQLTSDGRWFARDGIPIILFGPGDVSLAHAVDEFVPIAEVVEAARFLTVLGLRWLEAPTEQSNS